MSGRLFIITGEPSGDLHGSNLVAELKRLDPSIEIECWGGGLMQSAGAVVKKHIDELSIMGFVEVVRNLPRILRNFRLAEAQIAAFQPQAVVLIDFPGFNLRMAARIKKLGIPVVYYIAPQAWAWKESRVQAIRKYVDHLFVILPFEADFFQRHGIRTTFVGHPLLDEFEKVRDQQGETAADQRPIVAILPGSRAQEIEQILPLVAPMARAFENYQFHISKVSWQPMHLYERFLGENVRITEGRTYELLASARAAIVTSGTATLETAMLRVPQVVVYRANGLSIWIARRLIRVKFISLVNLILDRPAVCELIQKDLNANRLAIELRLILADGERRRQLLSDYDELIQKLGVGGASERVALALLKIIA